MATKTKIEKPKENRTTPNLDVSLVIFNTSLNLLTAFVPNPQNGKLRKIRLRHLHKYEAMLPPKDWFKTIKAEVEQQRSEEVMQSKGMKIPGYN